MTRNGISPMALAQNSSSLLWLSLRLKTASPRSGAVRVKRTLGDIQPDCGNLRRGRLLQVVFNISTMAHRCRRGPPTPSSLPGMCHPAPIEHEHGVSAGCDLTSDSGEMHVQQGAFAFCGADRPKDPCRSQPQITERDGSCPALCPVPGDLRLLPDPGLVLPTERRRKFSNTEKAAILAEPIKAEYRLVSSMKRCSSFPKARS